jgi:hypothetical protein
MTLNNLNTTILEKFDKFKFKGWDEEEKVEVELSEFLSPDEVGQLKQFLLSAIKEAWESGRGEKRNKTKYKYKNTSGKVGGVSGVALTTDNARPQGNSKPSDESVVYMCETILGYLDMGMVDRAKQHLENLQRWFIYLPTEGELLKVKQSK